MKLKKILVLFLLLSMFFSLVSTSFVCGAESQVSSRPMLVLCISFDADGKGIDSLPEGLSSIASSSDASYGEAWFETSNEDLSLLLFNDSTSVSAYFEEMSLGKLKYTPASENEGVANDGLVHITLQQAHVEALAHQYLEGTRSSPLPVTTQEEALSMALDHTIRQALCVSDEFVNYSLFDTNQDGTVCSEECTILLLFAGITLHLPSSSKSITHPFGIEASTESITYTTKDQVTISQNGKINLPCIGETINDEEKITPAIIAHEIAHALGCEDLYDISVTNTSWPQPSYFSLMHNTVANYSVLDFSSRDTKNTIPYLDPYQRLKLDMVSQIIEVRRGGSYTIYSTLSGQYSLLRIQTPDPDEYFLVEYRENAGFEKNIASSSGGFLVWLIDEKINREFFDSGLSCSLNHDPGITLLAHGITEDGYSYSTNLLDDPYFHDNFTFDAGDFASPLEGHSTTIHRFPEGCSSTDYNLYIEEISRDDGSITLAVSMTPIFQVTFVSSDGSSKTSSVLYGKTVENISEGNWYEQDSISSFDFSTSIKKDLVLFSVPGEYSTTFYCIIFAVLCLIICIILLIRLRQNQTLKKKSKN